MRERYELFKEAYTALLQKVDLTTIDEGFKLSISQEALANIAISYAETALATFYNLKSEEEPKEEVKKVKKIKR